MHEEKVNFENNKRINFVKFQDCVVTKSCKKITLLIPKKILNELTIENCTKEFYTDKLFSMEKYKNSEKEITFLNVTFNFIISLQVAQEFLESMKELQLSYFCVDGEKSLINGLNCSLIQNKNYYTCIKGMQICCKNKMKIENIKFVFCKICKIVHSFCDGCTSCFCCGNVFSCKSNVDINKTFCHNEKHMCVACVTVCVECHRTVCKICNESEMCDFCEKKCCGLNRCLMSCVKCKKKFCNDCKSECVNCDNFNAFLNNVYSCITCGPILCKCQKCGNKLCIKHNVKCGCCKKIVCVDGIFCKVKRCSFCTLQTCEQCRRVCAICEKVECNNCGKKFNQCENMVSDIFDDELKKRCDAYCPERLPKGKKCLVCMKWICCVGEKCFTVNEFYCSSECFKKHKVLDVSVDFNKSK